ncbi:MAG: NAD(+) synthase, partial [Lysobacterales bacterium]
MRADIPSESLYAHGFVRVAACTPCVTVADVTANLRATLELARDASAAGAALAVFPELGLCAYSIDDLVAQDALLDAVEGAAAELVRASAELDTVLVFGAPLRAEGKLFNSALVVYRGRLLGVVPKSYLPNYREFYEKRHFAAAGDAVCAAISVAGHNAPFGNDLLFAPAELSNFVLHVEICEDVWTPIPPSTYAALGVATVLANLSASNATIGKADYRRLLCASQSAKCVAAYVYSAAGFGESTTDLAWDGHAIVYENGERLAESQRFNATASVTMADLDLERLRQERMRVTSFTDCVAVHRQRATALRRIEFSFDVPTRELALARDVARFPFVPADPGTLDKRCSDAFNIQVQGLMQRLRATNVQRVVIGVSGGLDSTHALIVCAQTMDRLGLPRRNVLAYSLPAFGTTAATHECAQRLMQSLDVSAAEIDIRPSARQMLADIGHPYARGEEVYDLTFENVQAGERTSHLFRLANRHGALVVGTSDLSELALGYTTYGVGDQMAHYHVNASVPKTLIQHLLRWLIAAVQVEAQVADVLREIVAAEFSPELVPAHADRGIQRAEETVGPYELQDFNLYYASRFGLRPSKIAFLAEHAWSDRRRGVWPRSIPDARRHEYDRAAIKRWLEVFIVRFFALSQFKRSAMPNAPKVGSGG